MGVFFSTVTILNFQGSFRNYLGNQVVDFGLLRVAEKLSIALSKIHYLAIKNRFLGSDF